MSPTPAPGPAGPRGVPPWLEPLAGSGAPALHEALTEADPFVRLWQGFMTARVMIALTVLVLLALARMGGPPWSAPIWLVALRLATPR